MKPLVSVVIPVYNCEQYVEQAIKSIILQSGGKQVEIIVVDDGSTDQSGMICDEMAKAHENIVVYHKENGGVSSARNLGINAAQGKYIAFLDSDDWWEPDFLDDALIAELSSDASADVYQFSYREVNAYYSLEKVNAVTPGKTTYSEPCFGKYDWHPHCSFLFLAESLRKNKIPYPSAKIGEDGAFVEMAMYNIRSLTKIDKSIFVYYEHLASAVHTTKKLRDVREMRKATLVEEAYFHSIDVKYDADEGFVWQAAANLKKICAEESYATVSDFMEREISPILNVRPEIHFSKERWSTIEAWQTHPRRFWLQCKIIVGIPLAVKKWTMRIPGVRRGTNYIFSRFHRGFQKIKKEQRQHLCT
ncbi:MAG: glycosyltransferase family 2 protein [Clostridiales bacterium]|nr:glycosyltransferase family 2 protein [Clostridiales bacterium]